MTTSTDPFSRQVLEFNSIIALLGNFLSGPISKPLLSALQPRTEVEHIQQDLGRVADALAYLRASARPSLGVLKDPRAILERLAIEGTSCDAQEILALVELARVVVDFRALFVKSPYKRLVELAGNLPDFRSLVAELEGKILPDGSVDSSASPELARIRRSIERLRRELEAALHRLLRSMERDRVLQDAVITIRNDRFVIPVRAEEKRRVAGVVHGTSSSGATVYIEPLETLPLNNELVEFQERELAEIRRILTRYSEKLRGRRQDLLAATETLSHIDLAFAKAEFARHYDCCLPEIVSGRTILLKQARHPLLEKTLRGQGRHSVPITIELKEPATVMVISGPNAGGKTVALKTLGVAVLMAQAGIPVIAEQARIPLFGRVLADIGDQQSIEANLSTFSAHIRNIQSTIEVSEPSDLILLDEIGGSTEPSEGAALAVAILEYFCRLGAATFVTTHHSRLKAFAAQTPVAVNAAMEFDETSLQPTFRLLIGLPGKSSALDIASRLGLKSSVVQQARALLHPADAEAAALLALLHEKTAELEEERARLGQAHRELAERQTRLERQFEEERRAKLRELDARLEETLQQQEKKWEASLATLRAQGGAPKAAKKAQRTLAALKHEAREDWNAQVLATLGAPTAEEESTGEMSLEVGDRVRVENLSKPGVVTALVGDNHVDVEVGRIHLRVPTTAIRLLARRQPSPPGLPVVTTQATEVPTEINVIGHTAEEACERVDRFLDQAYLAGRFRLRVIHGHGKGILRKALHDMFSSHPHVEKFYPAPAHEGGAGATVVELKG